MYRLISAVSYFYLYFSYLRKRKTLSHEFKTPATAIRVTAERTLRKIKENDDTFFKYHFEHYMQSIIEYSDLQIIQVTTNLFMTRSNSSIRSKFNVGRYSIISIIKESINIIRPIARDHGAMFDNIEISDDFPNKYLKVDMDAFKMVFYNLLSNAIKYRIPDRDFHVLLSAKDCREGLFIEIEDRGIGVTKGDEERIFLLGVRSKNASIMNAEGYGIGLHVVRLIIEAFGGEIKLTHHKNPTIFAIKLPRNLIINN